MESYLKNHNKAIVVPNILVSDGVYAPGNNFGFIEIISREKVNFEKFTEIDLFTAISRGLINRKGDEIVWGGIVRYSIHVNKL